MVGKTKNLIIACLLACAFSAQAELFDFRNDAALSGALDNQPGPVIFTSGPITATFTASDGDMNITGSGFGLNSNIPSDDTDGFDIGEWIDITFGSAVTLSNVNVSSWSTANGDQATIYVNGTSHGVITSTGDHAFSITVPIGQVLRISSTAGSIGNGWSLNSISVDSGAVTPSNTAPVLPAIGNKSLTISNALNFAVSATDLDGDLITLSASNLPPAATFITAANTGSVTGQFNWAVAAPTGTYTTTFTADDGTTNVSETITITVSNAPLINVAPVLDPIGSRSVTEGQLLMFMVSASDANNDPLTYTASDLPPGAMFETNTITPQFTWASAGPAGVYTSRFTVADGTTNDFEEVVITVNPLPPNNPPVMAPISNQAGTLNNTLSFTVSAVDIDNDPIVLSASNLPPSAVFNTVTNTGNVTGLFSWPIAAPAGTYTTTFYADDGTTNVSETIDITITERPALMITEVADPDGTGGGNYRFIEIYNAGTSPVILESGSWFLSKQVNGGSWSDIPLAGTISAGGTWVVAYNATDFQTAYGFAPDQASSSISGTGDDAYFLYTGGDHDSGTLVDIYGALDTDGTDTAWDYEDSRAERNNNILQPNTQWTASEWTISVGAVTNDMSPGIHGPAPEFENLNDVFVFLTDDLSLTITAVNTVKTDVITLSAAALPAGATFPTTVGTDRVSSTLNWVAPAAGTYSATFTAEGSAGPRSQSIQITVSSTTQIDTYFYGWSTDTIVKLANGQFWRNTGGVGSAVDRLRRPDLTITKLFGKYRMIIDDVPSYTTVEPISITESTLDSDFSGLHNGSIYELSDGTVWEQISFENISSTADPVTVWRWTEDGDTSLRFLDRTDAVIGTCAAVESEPPSGGPITSRIGGWFRGWENDRVFVLENGQFWQQITVDSTSDTLYRPSVTVIDYLETGTMRLYVDGALPPGYVEVQRRMDITRTAIDGTFYGFGPRNFFHMQDGSWWRQTSADSSASTRSNPEILIWNGNGTITLELPDEGRSVTVEKLDVLTESTIDGDFRGLRYAHYYNLANGQDWMQISFENIPSDAPSPNGMVWSENEKAFLLIRDQNDRRIGTCEVADPWGDDDGDGVRNVDEMIAGTSLLDRNDFFYIWSIEANTAGRPSLRWPAVAGRIYTIEWTSSLLQPFQSLETLTDWTQDSWTDTINPPGSGGFYRIRVEME